MHSRRIPPRSAPRDISSTRQRDWEDTRRLRTLPQVRIIFIIELNQDVWDNFTQALAFFSWRISNICRLSQHTGYLPCKIVHQSWVSYMHIGYTQNYITEHLWGILNLPYSVNVYSTVHHRLASLSFCNHRHFERCRHHKIDTTEQGSLIIKGHDVSMICFCPSHLRCRKLPFMAHSAALQHTE